MAAVLIVGGTLKALLSVASGVCEAIPDPLCVGGCGTNPLKVVCWIAVVAARIIVKVYSIFEVGIELHDGVVDGAEIQSTLENSKTLITAACTIESQIESLKDIIEQRLDAVDDTLLILHRLLISPNGQRPGWNDVGDRCDDDNCPLPALPIFA